MQHGHERHLRQVETLAQQVDADDDVERAQAQVAQDFHPLHRVDVAVQVAHLEQQTVEWPRFAINMHFICIFKTIGLHFTCIDIS
jgi:hypothetical protein